MKVLLVLLAPLCILMLTGSGSQAIAYENAAADVAVIVDTSTSMKQPGMDPERSSLLVTKLFSDIVPGDLAVIRLLGIGSDRNLLPSRPTNEFAPCDEDPGKMCQRVERTSDWQADVRAGKFGALPRPSRGDPGFKKNLEAHLAQVIGNSMFDLAFRSAQGVFDGHRGSSPKTIVWLSDGRSDFEDLLLATVAEVRKDGIAVEAIVFGAGDTRLPRAAGLDAVKVSNPAEMMKAFAQVFRRIVEAPYRIDNRIAAAPAFEIKRYIQEAWVVVYGDPTLAGVELTGPLGPAAVDYAADRWPTAGAYRVAYLRQPPAGTWTLRATGGGPDTAYAVIQRSDLRPILLEPKAAETGIPATLVAGIAAGPDDTPFTDPEILQDAMLGVEVQGRTLILRDDGTDGDAAANDGRYSGHFTFPAPGTIPLRLRLQSPVADATVDASIPVAGGFRYRGGPLTIDLGTLGASAESCRPLVFQAEQKGAVAFELKSLRRLPSGHRLEVRLPAGTLDAGEGALIAKPGERMEVCLKTSTRIASSEALGEPWLALQAAGGRESGPGVPIHLRWQVRGLSFWALWGWLMLSLLVLLLILFVILGYLLPARFQATLSLVFGPDREDLDEQSPQPIRQWRGVGIGFYRNARAFLHPDYRLSGQARGALASLHAETGGQRALPGAGTNLFRETLDGDWEPVPPGGCRSRAGDVYRIGATGPYFRIAAKG